MKIPSMGDVIEKLAQDTLELSVRLSQIKIPNTNLNLDPSLASYDLFMQNFIVAEALKRYLELKSLCRVSGEIPDMFNEEKEGTVGYSIEQHALSALQHYIKCIKSDDETLDPDMGEKYLVVQKYITEEALKLFNKKLGQEKLQSDKN